MLRIFFLVCSQLTVGGLALMRLVPTEEIGKGFFRTCASIYLLIWVLVLVGLEWDRPWEFLAFALFTFLFLAYFASLWIDKLPNSARLLELTSTVGVCDAGVVVDTDQTLDRDTLRGPDGPRDSPGLHSVAQPWSGAGLHVAESPTSPSRISLFFIEPGFGWARGDVWASGVDHVVAA
jgi:hypothetical protein